MAVLFLPARLSGVALVPKLWEAQCQSATSTQQVANDRLPPRAHRRTNDLEDLTVED
jgi:hypothetical protein